MYLGEPKVFFQVPSTQTFDDADYSVEAAWSPNNSSKICELYDVSELLHPSIVVICANAGAGSISAFTYPYMVVTKVGRSINEDGMEVATVTGYNGTAIRTYYAKDINTLDGVKKGDFITMAGKKDVIWAYEHVTCVEEILNENYDVRETGVLPKYNVESAANWCASYEVWDYNDETRGLIVQRGTPTGVSNKRDFQKVSWYMTDGVAYGGLISCTYNQSTGDIRIKNGSISDIKGARKYGFDNCSKVMLIETNNYTWRMTIIVNVE